MVVGTNHAAAEERGAARHHERKAAGGCLQGASPSGRRPGGSTIETVAVRPAINRISREVGSSLILTGIRCASRTQLKVGLTLASAVLLALRSRSSIPAAILSTLPCRVALIPMMWTSARLPPRLQGSFVSSKYPST